MKYKEYLLEKLIEQLKIDEGFRPKAYRDGDHYSIGYGTPADYSRQIISKSYAEKQLRKYASITLDECFKIFKDKLKEIDEVRLLALANMLFNLGMPQFLQFKRMLHAIDQKEINWKLVSFEAKESKWYHQVGKRAKRIVKELKEGKSMKIFRAVGKLFSPITKFLQQNILSIGVALGKRTGKEYVLGITLDATDEFLLDEFLEGLDTMFDVLEEAVAKFPIPIISGILLPKLKKLKKELAEMLNNFYEEVEKAVADKRLSDVEIKHLKETFIESLQKTLSDWYIDVLKGFGYTAPVIKQTKQSNKKLYEMVAELRKKHSKE